MIARDTTGYCIFFKSLKSCSAIPLRCHAVRRETLAARPAAQPRRAYHHNLRHAARYRAGVRKEDSLNNLI